MPASDTLPYDELWGRILRGSYPELAANPQRDARLWQASYMQTYLERDVRNLRNIGDLTQFQSFLRSLATRSAGLLNLSDLARDVGVSVNTAKDWLAILEASFQVFLLRPYFVNLGKRLVKAPKVYFTDTGLLCYLVGLRDAEHAAAGPMGGALFENLVVAELFKTSLHQGEEPAMYFWRTAAGSEVDLVIDIAVRPDPRRDQVLSHGPAGDGPWDHRIPARLRRPRRQRLRHLHGTRRAAARRWHARVAARRALRGVRSRRSSCLEVTETNRGYFSLSRRSASRRIAAIFSAAPSGRAGGCAAPGSSSTWRGCDRSRSCSRACSPTRSHGLARSSQRLEVPDFRRRIWS